MFGVASAVVVENHFVVLTSLASNAAATVVVAAMSLVRRILTIGNEHFLPNQEIKTIPFRKVVEDFPFNKAIEYPRPWPLTQKATMMLL